MEFLGLHWAIWVVVVFYFILMLLMGWWSKQGIHNQEGFLLGNRQFGVSMMIMHAFGAGTNPGDMAAVVSKTVSSGASGVWISWMWMFGTPFYWLIAPVIRRMRYLTLADFFEKRFSRAASVLYVLVASIGMMVFLASVLLATARTVQGMMGKASAQTSEISFAEKTAPASDKLLTPPPQNTADASQHARNGLSKSESEIWFFGIILVITAVFLIYSYWGGIVAAVRTDMIQGLMIIALSILAIPAVLRLQEVGGLHGMRATLKAQSNQMVDYMRLFDPKGFDLWTVLLLSINAPLGMLAMPHLMSVCAAGRTEWEGRMGFTYGNIAKRICTIGWSILGLCWLAYLIKTGTTIHPDASFGDSIRFLLAPVLQGVMLACVMAAAMSSGDAVQVTVAGLFSNNIYRVYFNKEASEQQLVRVTRIVGLIVAGLSLVAAILMRSSIVKTILDFLNIIGLVGISTAMGILWRRMNTTGMFVSTISAVLAFVLARYVLDCERAVTVGMPILAGILGGVLGSLITKAPDKEKIDNFFKRIYVPIGAEKDLDLSLDQAVPPSQRLCTAGGLFIVKPSRQSWLGFLITLAICIGCVVTLWLLLHS